MNYLKLTPLDSWFFRDGRPFHQGEASVDIESIFPPSAFTVVGAIRAYFAGMMGWRDGKWNEEIIRILGDGYNLGPLGFRGPFLGRGTKEGVEPLFPVPLHMLGKSEGSKNHEFCLLAPGEGIECDLGKAQLPAAKSNEGMKALTRHYLTAENLENVLQGRVNDLTIVASKDLWDTEYAVGLARDGLSRTAKEGSLYSSRKIRLKERACLLIGIEGMRDDLEGKFFLPMGGESRMTIAEKIEIKNNLFRNTELQLEPRNHIIRFTVTHLTPAWLDRWPSPGEGLPGVPGRVISACLARPLRIGGWDSVKGEPVALKPFIRPGSTWFCETDKDNREAVLRLHGCRIGEYTSFGFGEVVIGAWRS